MKKSLSRGDLNLGLFNSNSNSNSAASLSFEPTSSPHKDKSPIKLERKMGRLSLPVPEIPTRSNTIVDSPFFYGRPGFIA